MFTTDATGAPPRPIRHGLYLRISRTRVVVFTLMLVGSWFAIFGWGLTRPRVATTANAAAPLTTTTTTTTTTTPTSRPVATGPWGELEVTPIDIEPPADAADRFTTVDTSTWYFRDVDAQQLAQLLHRAGLTDEQCEAILKSSTPDMAAKGIAVKPDSSVIL